MRRSRLISLIAALLLLAAFALPASAQTYSGSMDTVLVLDCSGSMEGEPLAELKKDAKSFCASILSGSDRRVAIISYSDEARVLCEFTDDITVLNSAIDGMVEQDMTNMYDALCRADELLNSSTADNKVIVLMTDGLPNYGSYSANGRYSSSDYDSYLYANAVYYKAVELHSRCKISTLGFFHNLDGETRQFAIRFLKDLENNGYYEASESEELEDEFDRLAADLTGDKAKNEDESNILLYIILGLLILLLALGFTILGLVISAAKKRRSEQAEQQPSKQWDGMERCPRCGAMHHYTQVCACMAPAPNPVNVINRNYGGGNMNTQNYHYIKVLCGSMKDHTVPIEPGATIYIGRDPHCDLVLSEDYYSVSRRHCSVMLRPAGDRFEVMDLSKNGTYLNGVHKLTQLVNTQAIPGTRLELGDSNCVVEIN